MRNPKQEGTRLYDCKPQTGLCPIGCNQCFFNRPGAFFTDPEPPHMPDVGDGIVRVNSVHDSNVDRELVIESTAHYKHRFFNTSLPQFDFPGPIVFTANRNEKKYPFHPPPDVPNNLMFVRMRVSPANVEDVWRASRAWVGKGVPVVLTFMRYYDGREIEGFPEEAYEYKKHIKNAYWCPTREFMASVMKRFACLRLVSTCGTLDSSYCKDCRNCEHWYWITKRRMDERDFRENTEGQTPGTGAGETP